MDLDSRAIHSSAAAPSTWTRWPWCPACGRSWPSLPGGGAVMVRPSPRA